MNWLFVELVGKGWLSTKVISEDCRRRSVDDARDEPRLDDHVLAGLVGSREQAHVLIAAAVLVKAEIPVVADLFAADGREGIGPLRAVDKRALDGETDTLESARNLLGIVEDVALAIRCDLARPVDVVILPCS